MVCPTSVAAPAYYSVMHLGMPWIEGRLLEEYGIDITPCHDTDGAWNPGPDCGGFPQDSATGHGTWENGCSGGPVGGYSSACGPGFDELPPDVDPPVVAITTPVPDERFDGVAPIDISIAATADDGEGRGVEHVRLVVDGVPVEESADTEPPFEWTLALVDGVHTVVAVGRDVVGNEGESAPVTIGVNTDAQPPADTGDTGETGGDPELDDEKEGCGCTSSSSSRWPGVGMLGLLAGGLFRRRRS